MKEPHVVFVNRFYHPDLAPTARLLRELAEGLVERGFRVTVVTGRIAYRGGPGRLPRRDVHCGVDIERVRSTALGSLGLAGRVADYATFLVSASWRLLRLGRPDVIVAGSDPPLLHVPVALTARLGRRPYVVWSQDVYPEVALAAGVFRRRGPAYRLLSLLSRLAWRRSEAVVVLGDRMADRMIEAGVPRARLRTIPNWVDTGEIRPAPEAGATFRVEHGLEGRFVVLYAGNAGRAHTFDAVPRAAEMLRVEDVLFVFAGGGARRPWLEAEFRRRELGNARFLGYQPADRLSAMLSAGDVGLVTEATEVEGLVVPSKTFGVMAAGLPVLYLGPAESDVARVVESERCGIVVAPGDAAGLVDAIRRLREDSGVRSGMAERARAVAEERFERSVGVERWASALRGAADR